MEMNVFIADEQTLFAALRMINLTWTHIAQAENHEKVYELANEILDRVGKFMKNYESIGKAIENAQKAFDEGGKKLAPGGHSIIQTCAKLEKLGAKQNRSNPIPQIDSVTGIE
jgi:DNA recombination protein RmuC